MNKRLLKLANYFAIKSVEADFPFNNLSWLGYKAIANLCTKSKEQVKSSTLSQHCKKDLLDSYLTLYRETNPKDWGRESIVDLQKFEIRSNLSYICWKIKELTRRWPNQRLLPHQHFTPRSFRFYMFINGYTKKVNRKRLNNTKHYVGIGTDEVVWFHYKDLATGKVYASTYRNQRFFGGEVYPAEYLWIEVDPRCRKRSIEIDFLKVLNDDLF